MIILGQIFTDVALKNIKREIDDYFIDKTKTRKHRIVYSPETGQFGVQLKDEFSDDVKGSSVLFISEMHSDDLYETKLFVSIPVIDIDRYIIINEIKAYID